MEKRPDYFLLGVISSLVILGLFMIASIGVVMSQQEFGQTYYFFKKQLFNGVFLGIIVGFICYKMPNKLWKKIAPLVLLAGVALLLVVFIPGVGVKLGGARRWVALGPLFFQPAELFKLAFIIYLASWLDRRRELIKSKKDPILPFIIIMGISAGLIIKQPDMGTAVVIIFTGVIMYIAGGVSLKNLGILGMTGIVGLVSAIKIAPYRMQRLMVFFNPTIDTQKSGYQLHQAKIALGSGGIFGLGLGQSKQKFNYLPEPIGDSIFAVIGEELGVIGALAVVILFVIFIIRGLRVAKNATDGFSQLLAVGIVGWISSQALVNIAALTGLAPLTGIPLPFISYGSSALVALGAGSGILLNISKK